MTPPAKRGCTVIIANLAGALLLTAALTVAQALPQSSEPNPASQRSFHASKGDVQKALRELPSYPGGKLPVLDGFANADTRSLESYRQGHYQYEVQITAKDAAETKVTVTAKITAWYESATPANSGYRLLKSSGRLESDLLDALEEKLNPGAARATSEGRSVSGAQALPDSPSAITGGGSFFNTPRLASVPSSANIANAPPAKPVDPGTAKRLQALREQAANLEQILHDQVRPDNLAVVKRSNTPVVAQPLNGAEVMFQAEAEDEFEILDATESWVHIKISGISRGWIRRDYVDLPGAATVSLSSLGADTHETELVRQTREEVAAFPGKWEPLNGKQVKIVWVQPLDKEQFGSEPRWNLAKSVFRKVDAGSPADEVAGVVVIFDSQDGGMAATTLANLQQWRAGHLSDETFWKRCWRDPPEAFNGQSQAGIGRGPAGSPQ